MAKKSIEDIYGKLSQREHVLKRPDTYVGSLHETEDKMFVVEDIKNLDDIKIKKDTVKFSPAFIKIFDEVITNASDHYIRTGKVRNIKVTVEADHIIVENDGPGIPVQIHKEEKIYVPELIFFNLLAGQNFDDTEQRFVGGRNGLGAKLTAIYSKKFIIETADGKKKYKQTVVDNLYAAVKDDKFKAHLDKHSSAKISASDKNYTKITYYPDFEKFGMTGFTDDVLKILAKRTLDVAVYCPKAKVTFNGQSMPVKTMKDFMKLHLPADAELFYEKLDNEWEVGVAKSLSESFEQVSIVNAITTYRGGTHINYISLELSKDLAELITKGNKKLNISWFDVKNKVFLFLICRIPNPEFDTQTKENLKNVITRDMHQGCKISEVTLKKIMKSEIIQSIMDAIEAKQLQDLKRMNRNLQNAKVEKLIDAKGKERNKCILGIFEGEAAITGVRKNREPNIFGAYPLRGKFKNVSEESTSVVIKDKEVQGLISCLGLHLGDKVKEDQLRYGKIYIYTDADHDGDSIASLLINFFYKYWKELFEQGRIYKVLTPLLVAEKGKDKRYFYSQEEYEKWAKGVSLSNWNIEYKKGLASLVDEEYDMIINEPYLIQLTPDVMAKETLDVWFAEDTSIRKQRLMK